VCCNLLEEKTIYKYGNPVPTMADSTEPCLVACCFFQSDGSLNDEAVRCVVGKEIHVEVMLFGEHAHQKTQLGNFSFTSFVNEDFAMSVVNPNIVCTRTNVTNLIMSVSQTTATRLFDYYQDLHQKKIPYNWSDSRLLMPFCNPHTFYLFPDVDAQNPPSVFCSQMVVLGMRECMDAQQDQNLLNDLTSLNSRLTSPHTLFNVLCQHGATEIPAKELAALVQQARAADSTARG
jgi:hypothetical protein